MDKKQLQENILEAKYDRSQWISILREWFGAKQLNQNPPSIKRDTKDWENYVESAYELGRLFTDDGMREVGIFEVELKANPKIEINRVKLRSLLSNIYGTVDGALIVFTQGDKWRFSYVSEILDRDANDNVVSIKTEPKRFTYFFGDGENCRTAADRFDKLKGKPLALADLNEAFSVEKLSKEFFKSYKEHFEKFWKYLAENKSYYELLSDREKEDEGKKTKPIRDFVKVLLGRLVFLQFLQKKGWMGGTNWTNGDAKFIQNLFAGFPDKVHFHSTALRTLFFETLNSKRANDLAPAILGNNIKIPYLNGGLFDSDVSAKHAIDFPADYFRDLLRFFEQYNFTIDESDAFDREVGIDPEMLGHIFENLLEENREKGAFYTPKEIVRYMCQESLIEYLSTNLSDSDKSDIELLVRHNVVSESIQNDYKRATAVNDLLKAVKICDPAIGSGAFPMGLLKEIFECRRLLFAPARLENFNAASIKKEIIQNNIYGVDIEPGAVDIARLRFWLSLVVDEEEPQPLPNLDYKIMQGNSLLERFDDIDLKFDKSKLTADYEPERNLFGDYKNPQVSINDFLRVQQEFDEQFNVAKLEKSFFYSDSAIEKNSIREKIERLEKRFIKERLQQKESETNNKIAEKESEIERKLNSLPDSKQREVFLRSRIAKDLEKLKSKLAAIHKNKERLAKIKSGNKPYFLWRLYFVDVFDQGGFDIFIGNPPYIQLQKLGAETVEYEKAGFQTFAGKGDIYCLFYELGTKILKPKGTLCFITSNKWMRSEYGESTRKFFSEETNPILLIDFAGQKIFESATVDTNILLFSNEKNQQKTLACVIKEKVLNNLSLFVRQNANYSGFATSDSWVILSPIEQRIKEKIERIGTPLKDWDIQINYGVKTGFNEAFIIDGKKRRELIDQDPKSEEIIRPILRGRDIKRYRYEFADRHLIATFPSKKYNIDDYPVVKEHLLGFGYDRLKQTGEPGARKKTNNKWFETQDSISYWEDFYKQKIVWADLARTGNAFTYDASNSFLSNTCYILTLPNENDKKLKFILGILNSKLVLFYMNLISSKLDETGWRWFKQFVEILPIPLDENKFSEIASITELLISTKTDRQKMRDYEKESNNLIYKLFELSDEEIKFIDSMNLISSLSKP